MAAIFWDVYRDGRLIDSVPFDAGCDEDCGRRSLIDHDGYPTDIEISGPFLDAESEDDGESDDD